MDYKRSITGTPEIGYNYAQYKVADNIGVGITVMPRLGVYNITESKAAYKPDPTGDSDVWGNSFQICFSMPVVVGASYSF